MKKILTKKEAEFITMLAALIEDYDAYFSVDEYGGISVTICDEAETDGWTQEIPIHFPSQFDENEIAFLLQNNLRQVESIAKGVAAGSYQVEDYLLKLPVERVDMKFAESKKHSGSKTGAEKKEERCTDENKPISGKNG